VAVARWVMSLVKVEVRVAVVLARARAVGGNKDNSGNSTGGGGIQQSTKRASGRNDGDCNGNSN
jgi:hypothetical protein